MRGFPNEGYPALYQAADAASGRGQRLQVRILRIELLLVLAGAAIGYLAVDARLAVVVPLVAAGSFLAAAFLKVVSRDRHYDQQWFDGRAVAETAKSATWRYMMRVPPFDDDASAGAAFAARLRAILEARPNLHAALAIHRGGDRQITNDMRRIRSAKVDERRDIYRRERIADQIDWYRGKSVFHRRRAERYFWLSVATEVVAIVLAALGLYVREIAGLNILSLLAALSTAATALGQISRHDELSTAYGLAYQELTLINGLTESVSTESALAQVVSDAEGAISREHTMWIAKVARPGSAEPREAESRARAPA